MSNPVPKVCRIIESCETPGQLEVARRVALRCTKQVPDSAFLIEAHMRAATINIEVNFYVGNS